MQVNLSWKSNCLWVVSICALLSSSALLSQSRATEKRAVEVGDVIAMTRLADPSYAIGGTPEAGVAQFSPDAKRFVIVLRKGNLSENVNEYSMYLYETETATAAHRGRLIVTMRSSSERAAIKDVHWLSNDRTVMFVGENPGENPQVYSVDVESHRLHRVTDQDTPVLKFQVSRDGRQVIYLASTPQNTDSRIPTSSQGALVITDQNLSDLLAGRSSIDPPSLALFKKDVHSVATEVWSGYQANSDVLSVSPDGRFAVVCTRLRASDLPLEWEKYDYGANHNAFVKSFFRAADGSAVTPFERYLLIDLTKRSALPLWNGPRLGIGSLELRWSEDSRFVFLRHVFLPLVPVNSVDAATKLKEQFDLKIDLSSLDWSIQPASNWTTASGIEPPLKITMEEDINTPPKIYTENLSTQRKALLLDLNPQFNELELGKVEVISWSVHGIPVRAGLYLPPDYVVGKRYPLVIQTHGFEQNRFSMDGISEWSSAYAARLLAARGIAVLQTYDFPDRADHDRVGKDKILGQNPDESFRTFSKLVYEGSIEELDRRGFIDPKRIGISGFSRTVLFVDYTLTHSDVSFKAALLADGIDGGYFNYLAFRLREFEEDNGGQAPFGEDGLKLWFAQSPGFSLDKVTAPVRLLCLDTGPSLLEAWEWFAGLKLLGKPVDMVAIPHGSHILQGPRNREIAMLGMADWFDFWLQDHERTETGLDKQYARWRSMRSSLPVPGMQIERDGPKSGDSAAR